MGDGAGGGGGGSPTRPPSRGCTHTPIRINCSTKESNCEHCRDFSGFKLKDKEMAASILKWTSMFVFGEREVQIIGACLGQWHYDKSTTLAEDGCVNIDKSASHARFD